MKKLFITLLILTAPAVTFAQFKVLSDGSAQSGSVAESDAQFFSSATPTSGKHIALNGRALTNAAKSIGVMGEALSGSNYCYGVYGCVGYSMYGAGVFGSSSPTFVSMPGNYAGFFNGTTIVNGTLGTITLNSLSDIRLKENINQMSAQRRQGETLDNVLGMNVLEYTFKEREVEVLEKGDDGDCLKRSILQKPVDDKLHFGLSAQELQEIYPNLVTEGADGYLSINYIELVPVLIQAIQELKQELDDVKGAGSSAVRKAAIATGMADATTIGNVLYQNAPNPFKEQTTIRFHLADDAQNAAICIFDLSGKLLKKLPVSAGMESISVAGYELGEGMFLYTLMVNGQEIDTKRMIITN